MIARGGEVLGQAGEQALARVMHFGQLAVHQIGRPHHLAAIDLADGLMTEAHAEDRHHRSGTGDQLQADAGTIRIARAGRQHDGLGAFRQHLVHGDLVVAVHLRARAQFPKEMNEIVGEAVVVIDQGQHGLVLRLGRSARQVSWELRRTVTRPQPARNSLGVRNRFRLPLLTSMLDHSPAVKLMTTSPAVGYFSCS